MASLYREVVLKEKPVQSEDGFIPLDALAKPNGNGNGNGHTMAMVTPLRRRSRKWQSRLRETKHSVTSD